MKTKLSLLLIFIVFFGSLRAQNLSVTEIKLAFSKEAEKAAKRGELFNAGAHWNSDRTQVHNFYIYKTKEGLMFQAFTLNSNGGLVSTEEDVYNAANMAKYSLSVEPKLVGEKGPGNIAGREFGYFKSTVLAGSPKMNSGRFIDKYLNDVWVGYDFKKGDQVKLDEKFWPTVSFSLSDGVDNQHYQTRKSSRLGRALAGNIDYIPMNGKAFLAGLMASTKSEYISGVFDMSSQTWDNKVITPMSSNPIGLTYAQTDYGVLAIVSMNTKDDSNRTALMMDYKGNMLQQIPLPFAQKEAHQPGNEMVVLEDGEAQFVVGPYFEGGKRNNPGLVFHKLTDKLEFSKLVTTDDIEGSLVSPPKSKAKLNKFYDMGIESIEKLSNGDYLLSIASRRDPVTTLLLQFSPVGDLKASYLAEGIEEDNNDAVRLIGKHNIHLGAEYIQQGETVYVLLRSMPHELAQGAHTSNQLTLDPKTVRIDELYAKGKLYKLNIGSMTISEPVEFEHILVGAQPYSIGSTGAFMFNSYDPKKKERIQLLVK